MPAVEPPACIFTPDGAHALFAAWNPYGNLNKPWTVYGQHSGRALKQFIAPHLAEAWARKEYRRALGHDVPEGIR